MAPGAGQRQAAVAMTAARARARGSAKGERPTRGSGSGLGRGSSGVAMSDIFISYKKEDAGRVVRIVEALRAEGFSVWWDHGIIPGSQWDQTIQRQLDAAKAVVGVWSELSVSAPWVKEESGVGKSRGILVPVRIDDVPPPLGFGLIQAADLIGWDGDSKDPRWTHFLAALKAVLDGKPGPAPVERPVKRRKSPWGLFGALAAALVLAAGLGIYWAATHPAATGRADPAAPRAPAVSLQAGPATPQEQALWDKALAEKSRGAFVAYLTAFPEGAFANRARDALLTCRTEKTELWKEQTGFGNAIVRGVASTYDNGPTKVEACAAAKADARKSGKYQCEVFTKNPGYRNAQVSIGDRDCQCVEASPVVTNCVADLPLSCKLDVLTTELTEICGG